MKKIVLLVLAIAFYFATYGQSLSFDEIYALRDKKDAGEFLATRSFTPMDYPSSGTDPIHFYICNEGTDKVNIIR